jgi:transcriptional regulator with XRE-family HTH domain
MSVGVRLRAIREALYMGRAEFAASLGISVKSLEKMEKERQRVTEEVFVGIGKNYRDFAYWFVTGETEVECGHESPDTYRLGIAERQRKQAE